MPGGPAVGRAPLSAFRRVPERGRSGLPVAAGRHRLVRSGGRRSGTHGRRPARSPVPAPLRPAEDGDPGQWSAGGRNFGGSPHAVRSEATYPLMCMAESPMPPVLWGEFPGLDISHRVTLAVAGSPPILLPDIARETFHVRRDPFRFPWSWSAGRVRFPFGGGRECAGWATLAGRRANRRGRPSGPGGGNPGKAEDHRPVDRGPGLGRTARRGAEMIGEGLRRTGSPGPPEFPPTIRHLILRYAESELSHPF